MLNGILDFLRSDGSIVINKRLAHKIGLDETIIYTELASQYIFWASRNGLHNDSGKQDENGTWFFCTVEKLEAHTTIKKGRQQRAIDSLSKMGLVETKKMGLPAKRFFRLTDAIKAVLFDDADKSAQNEPTDNTNVSEVENENKPRGYQSAQNEPTSKTISSELDEPFCATINNIFINNEFNNLEEEESAQLSALISAYKDSIDSKMTKTIEKSLYEWSKELSFDVLIDEIEFAAKKGAKSFSFLETMIQQDLKSNVTNINDLYAKRESFKKNSNSSSKKPVKRSENVPSWLNKDTSSQTSENTLSQEELLEIDRERQKLMEELRQSK